MKQLILVLGLFLFANTTFAQFDQSTCKEILSGYSKANTKFTKMTLATLDFEYYKQKFDIGWLKDFKFNFMEKVLDIEYTSDQGTYHVYIPYDRIMKINRADSALDIIIEK